MQDETILKTNLIKEFITDDIDDWRSEDRKDLNEVFKIVNVSKCRAAMRTGMVVIKGSLRGHFHNLLKI